MQDSFDRLLERLGIVRTFSDAAQNHKQYTASDELLLKLVNSLGFKLADKADSEILLRKIEDKRWQYVLEAVYVTRQQSICFSAAVKSDSVAKLRFSLHDTENNPLAVEYKTEVIATRNIGHSEYSLVNFRVLSALQPQYYNITLGDGEHSATALLAVTPDKCYVPRELSEQRLWGVAIQLYSLRSRRNWGVGDFTDLENMAEICRRKGADVIGVNPLNVLFHDYPENASPYSSISRLFLNPIYIDVEKVSGYKKEYVDNKALALARSGDNINYTAVYNLKVEVLRRIFADWRQDEKSQRYQEFIEYCNIKGYDLDSLALFQSIYSAYHDKVYGGWRSWPVKLQNPHSAEVSVFRKQHDAEIMFFKFMQYLADKQLHSVTEAIKAKGLKIGLYRDLPVGLCKDSAELWSNYDLFIKDCGAGAPPDVFFPKGQKWCLGAFNPFRLKESAYQPFIKILRAAMSGGGALRIDHVMSLMRLYIIPDDSEDGTYVYYNFEDMLGIVALESYLNRCLIVGECIGNVPDGFIDKIKERGIYSLNVLWGERWPGSGDFRMPYDFPREAFCSVGTHDMAPLKMRWFGYDIETMYQLKMISESERYQQYKGREDERRHLLGALDYNGVWPADKPRQGDCLYGEDYPNGIMEAVEKYMAMSNSAVYLAQPEDIFGVDLLQNLPGTDRDKHPNWRRRLPVYLEDFIDNDAFNRAADIIAESRK